jgi:hypothetical protein
VCHSVAANASSEEGFAQLENEVSSLLKKSYSGTMQEKHEEMKRDMLGKALDVMQTFMLSTRSNVRSEVITATAFMRCVLSLEAEKELPDKERIVRLQQIFDDISKYLNEYLRYFKTLMKFPMKKKRFFFFDHLDTLEWIYRISRPMTDSETLYTLRNVTPLDSSFQGSPNVVKLFKLNEQLHDMRVNFLDTH